MAKVALLVGVSEYELGLNPLPAASKDIEALREVLLQPEIGGFAESDVTLLKNPDRQVMEEAIYTLFSGRHKDDLLLLFFSGHGIKDEAGKLYLATRATRKTSRGELVSPTAVAAQFVHECMGRSRSKRQIVVLDSCFSGAFADGLSAKDDGSVDIRAQLGGEGRAVLTSSSSTEYSFEQAGEELSLYTRFLIEGIKTGNADEDADGVVSIDELHEYASRKVREVQPTMRPEIYASREGFKIRLTKVPPGSPSENYRKEVARFISRGEISFVGRKTLDVLQTRLGVSLTEAKKIEDEVLEPCRKDFRDKLRQYREVFVALIERDQPISEGDRADLRHSQQILGLRNEDTVPIEAEVLADLKVLKQNLQVYEQSLAESLRQEFPLSQVKQQQFLQMQQQMKLSDADVNAIHQRVTAEAEIFRQSLQQYEQAFDGAIRQHYPLSEPQRSELQAYQESLNLSEVDVAPIEAKITTEIKTYQQKIQQYEEAFLKVTQGKYRLSEVTRQQLQQTWQTLGLTEADVKAIETPILAQVETYQTNLRHYEQDFADATQQQYPLESAQRSKLRQLQQQFNLSDADVAPIETQITGAIEEHRQKLEQYEQVLTEAIQFEYPLSEVTREEILRFQQVLELGDEDAAQIEARILAHRETVPPIAEPMAELSAEPMAEVPPPEVAAIVQPLVEPVTLPQPEIPTEVSPQLPIQPIAPPPQFLPPKAPPVQAVSKPAPRSAPEPIVPSGSSKPSRTLLLAGVGAAIVGLGGVAALVLNGQSGQKAEETTLQRLKDLKAAGKFDDCASAAQEIKPDSRIAADARSLLTECRTANAQATLTKAKQLAKDGKFKEAIAESAKVPETAPASAEAKKLIEQWADPILQQATKKYEEEGKLDEAIALLQVIPATSENYKKAQDLSSKWKPEWDSSQKNLASAQKALEQQQWQSAINAVTNLPDTPFWRSKKDSILSKAESQLTKPAPTAVSPLPSPAAVNDPPKEQLSIEQPRAELPAEPAYVPPRRDPAPAPAPPAEPPRSADPCSNPQLPLDTAKRLGCV